MKGLLLIIFLCLGLNLTAAESLETFQLRGTVLSVTPLSTHSGKVTPVNVDPRYVMVLKIESVTPSITNFVKGSTNAFAIHSPDRLLGSEPFAGTSYTFQLKQTTIEGKTAFSEMKVVR